MIIFSSVTALLSASRLGNLYFIEYHAINPPRIVTRYMLQKKREEYESVFMFTVDAMLVFHASRKHRTVVVLSRVHHKAEMDLECEAINAVRSA
jgi:hypothetical protein